MITADRSARIFLGLTEGGLFPGVAFYLSLWYKRDEQARRVAIFFSAATIAGTFGGILAFAIEKLEGRAGLHGWAWIVSIYDAQSQTD
jgi:MFS family permease